MSRRLAALSLLVGAAGVALGSLVIGCASLFVSTDGLSGGAELAEGGGSEASVDAARPADGAVDAPMGDGAKDDAAALGFCASSPGHTFCDDFDDRPDVTVGWDTDSSGRSTLVSDVMRAKSAPRSFRVDTAAGPSGPSYAHLRHAFPATNRLRVAFDMFIGKPTADVGDSLGTVTFPQGYLDLVWYTSGHLTVTERTNNPNVYHESSVGLPADKWLHIEIECTPGQITVKIDGAAGIAEPATMAMDGAVSLALGLYSNDAFATSASYDNVLVDTKF